MPYSSPRRHVLAFTCALLLASTSLHAQQENNHFAQLGGMAGIEKIVAELIPLIETDQRISTQFKETNMDLLARQLVTQICQLSGGPCERKGDDMRTVHKGMNITNLQFNALAEDLQIAMERQNVPSIAQNKLLAKLAVMQREIVTK